MNISSAFNVPLVSLAPIKAAAAKGPNPDPATPPPPAPAASGTVVQGAFVTPQTIASFAGATFVVQLLWRVSGLIVPAWGRAPLVAFLASVLVGTILYLISETDANRGAISTRERLIGIFIAAINTLVIFSAAIGSGTVIDA